MTNRADIDAAPYGHQRPASRSDSSAERAYNDISARGYGRDDVNPVMSDDTRKLPLPSNT